MNKQVNSVTTSVASNEHTKQNKNNKDFETTNVASNEPTNQTKNDKVFETQKQLLWDYAALGYNPNAEGPKKLFAEQRKLH